MILYTYRFILNMHHWSIDTKKFAEEAPEQFKIWRLEHLINNGLMGEKIKKKELLSHWDKIYIEPDAKKYLEFLLWDKKY